MITIRRSGDRGLADFGWLKSRHTFSFGHYQDPQFMGHGPLRMINEDRVSPGAGFDQYGYRNMEIISWVLEGARGSVRLGGETLQQGGGAALEGEAAVTIEAGDKAEVLLFDLAP